MKKDTCLYIHTRKTDGRIFYVGIGDKYRPYETTNRNKYWRNTYKKYNRVVTILVEGLTWEEACKLEIMMIAFYGRKDKVGGCLVNMTDGGDGSKGKIVSDETKNKISQSNKGKIISENQKKQMRDRNKKLGIKPPPRTGYKHTEEARKKISKSGIGRKVSEVARRNMSLAQKGHEVSEEARKNMSKAQRAIGNKPPAQWGKKHNNKIVLDTNTGVFYETVKELSEVLGKSYVTFAKTLKKKINNKTSRYEFV